MDHVVNTTGQQQFACAGFAVAASVDEQSIDPLAPTTGNIYLSASGPESDGNICFSADGRVTSRVAASQIDVVDGGIVCDAGDEGNIGLRAGTAPMMQHIEVEGNGGNVVLENGQLPLAPKIEITPDSIVLSVGLNKITIGPAGIEITGLEVSVKGELATNVEGLEVSVKGDLTAALQGGVEATVKGAMVMIN